MKKSHILALLTVDVCLGLAIGIGVASTTSPVKPMARHFGGPEAELQLRLTRDNASAVRELGHSLTTTKAVAPHVPRCYVRFMQAVPGGAIGSYGKVEICE